MAHHLHSRLQPVLRERLGLGRPAAPGRAGAGRSGGGGGRDPRARQALLRGALTAYAAGLGAAATGLLVVLAPVFLLWIFSPYAEGGAGGALHTAACLWLLAHGTDLVRTTVDGGTAPLGVAPLLLTALALVLLFRAGRRAATLVPAVARAAGLAVPAAVRLLRWALVAGYLTVSVVAVASASGPGTVRARPWPALGWLVLCAAGTAFAAVRTPGAASLTPGARVAQVARVARVARSALERLGAALIGRRPGRSAPLLGPAGVPDRDRPDRDRPDPVVPGRPAAWPRVLPDRLAAYRDELPGAGRAGAAAALALLAAGAVVWGAGLVAHFGAAGRTAAALAPDLTGRLSLLLLSLAYVPDAALHGTAYALGPGFSLGTGSSFSPLGGAVTTPGTRLLSFPLLTAVPTGGAGSPAGAAALLAALAGGAVAGRFVCRGVRAGAGAEEPGAPGPMALAPMLRQLAAAAAVAGVLVGVACAEAGGPLGRHSLAHVGPDGPLIGAAAAVWTLAVGLSVVLFAHGRAAGWGPRAVADGLRTRRRKRPAAGLDALERDDDRDGFDIAEFPGPVGAGSVDALDPDLGSLAGGDPPVPEARKSRRFRFLPHRRRDPDDLLGLDLGLDLDFDDEPAEDGGAEGLAGAIPAPLPDERPRLRGRAATALSRLPDMPWGRARRFRRGGPGSED